MINNLLLGATDIVAKLEEAGIVVLIGVSMVFVVLFLLIGVVRLFQYVDKLMNVWDAKMAVYRANKAEVQKLKKSFVDEKDEKINALYVKLEKKEMTKADFKSQSKIIIDEYKAKKPEIQQAISELKAKQKASKNQTEEVAVKANEPVVEEVTDAKLIAIISAALAVATEQEQAERKVTFKVRSIKHIK